MMRAFRKQSPRITLASVLLLFAQQLHAQEPAVPNELDKLYVPGKNSVFSSGDQSSTSREKSSADISNAVTFNPGLLMRSTAALFYERWLGGQVSLKAGLGLCYNTDRIQAFTYDAGVLGEGLFNQPRSTVQAGEMMREGIFLSSRLYASLSFRVHFESYFGGDWSPFFEFNTQQSSAVFHLKHQEINYATYSFGSSDLKLVRDEDVHMRNLSFNLLWGTQFVTSGKVKTVHEFFLGAGVKNTSYEVFKTVTKTINDPLQVGDPLEVEMEIKTNTREGILNPAVFFGYVFGFGF